MNIYVGIYVTVVAIALGIFSGIMIVVAILYVNAVAIHNKEKKRMEKQKHTKKKRAERRERSIKKKKGKKALKEKLTNQEFTYADFLDSIEEENTEAGTIERYRQTQDRSYGIIANKMQSS